MAIFNEILVGRFNRSLQKAFGIKGSPPVRQIAGEIQPGYQINTGVENRYLEAWNRFGVAVNIPGNVGNVGAFQLRNSPGSNVIAVMEKITLISVVAGEFDLGYLTIVVPGDLATTTNGVPFDRRFGPLATGAAIQPSFTNVTPAAPIIIFRTFLPANTPIEVLGIDDHELPLLPGDIFRGINTVANSGVIFNIWWRERYLEESERA